ncbi:ZZ-type zinc finger-containing protein 3 isoform X2 [Poecilia formosa]|nr:PREDICTED: ZZ-type zinc finger-containing protein 3 isoform X2 [Poecilia formosa]XP_016534815.1 PREDICTED: ZZ-type zinc finger-containing protein 3 isoform X2 [Poecilia formosa]
MAASRSSRVTRSSVGLNGLDEKFCGRTLRNRSIAQPEETSVSPQPRARSPKKKQESKQDTNKDNRQESKHDARKESKHDTSKDSKQESKQDSSKDSKQESSQHANKVSKQESKPDTSKVSKQETKQDTSKNSKQESKQDNRKDSKQESKQNTSKDSTQETKQNNSKESKKDTNKDSTQESKQNNSKDSKQDSKQDTSKNSIKESKQDAIKESEQDAVKESGQDAVKESRQDAVKKSRQDAVKESRQDTIKESEQDAIKESEQDAIKESRQDTVKESRQDTVKESRQDTVKESRQDAVKESRQDAVKESRQESNDNKQDNKQDTGEELDQDFEPESKHAAKHDTKPQETSLQDSQQLDMLQRNIADSSIPAGDEDHSTVSRKRGMSRLEKDLNQEKSENCDTGKEWRNTSPPIKRAKQCSLAGEFLGHEEDQGFLNPQSQVSVSEPCKDLICEDLPSHNSCNAPPASSILSEQEGEVIGRQVKEDHCMDCDGPVLPQNSHKASNGLRETDAEETSTVTEHPSATPTSATSFPSLLNGSQMEAPSSPDSSVPFKNSVPGQMEVLGSGESPASSALTFMGAVEDPVPELIVAKEQEVEEVEVDVVGDPLGLAYEEQVTVSEGDTNGRSPSPVQEPAASTSSSTANVNCSSVNNSNSGETTPTPTTPQSPTEPECNPSMSSTTPSFTELNEHRYTLRTSPRRVVSGGKASPAKPSSPVTDNGPFREEGEVEDDCPMLEEPSCSDSVGLSSEEPSSVNPSCRAGEKDSDFMEDKETENGKELTHSETVEEEEEEEEEEPDVYYFESDHLALKHNKDYQRLLQTIVVLEAQRAQAILDLETLARQQREALSEPISFVEQLQKQANLGLPCPQRVVQLPDIAWEQYTSGLGEFEREFCDKKRKTRQLKLIFDKGLPLRPKSPVEPKKEGESSAVYSSLPTSDAPENGRQTQMIRGRICHPNKPDTFNQLWTVEEQKKLEQLLVKFPPEEVESKRWQKIADELGNRTAKQVASRVQKYFIKLTKAGIPVPGRTPNLCMYTKKASSKRQHHLNKHLYRPSTFLTSYEPPVYMEDEDERAAFYHSVQDPSADDSDEESVPVELRNLQEYKELLQLKRLKKQKLQEIREDNAEVQHMGYKCDVCGMEPIQGVRWHCQDCPPENSVDFCSNCSDCLFKTETHKPDHHLEAVYQPDTFLDRDYCLPQSAGYNYLDPNYFPANR